MRSSPVPSCAVVAFAALLGGCESASDAEGGPFGDYVESIKGTDIHFEMVWVPKGRFWMARTEVTWDEYLPYCDFEEVGNVPPGVDAVAKPSKPLDDITPFDRDWGLGKQPAVGMSRNAAVKYCEWLSLNTGRAYRLPTEKEWELACGARPEGGLDVYSWHEENSDQMAHEGGLKEPNTLGINDMLGNLWEYCLGPFSPDEPEREVLRGGSWSDPAAAIGPGARLGFEADWVLEDPNVPPGVWWVPDGDHLGFRILRSTEGAGN